jgi:hypothetical protein
MTAVSLVVAALIGAALGRQMASGHDPALSHKAKAKVAHVSKPPASSTQGSEDDFGQASTPPQTQAPAPLTTRAS